MKSLIAPLVLMSVGCVAVADIFLKRASLKEALIESFKTPWFFGALILYLVQILAIILIFRSGVRISTVGVLQPILYSTR